MEERDLLTTEAVAKRLHLTPLTIYRYVEKGKLKGYRFGNRLRFKSEDVDAFIAESMIGASPSPEPEK